MGLREGQESSSGWTNFGILTVQWQVKNADTTTVDEDAAADAMRRERGVFAFMFFNVH
jgi:hypothetical protein